MYSALDEEIMGAASLWMVLTTTGEAAASSGSVKPTNDLMIAVGMLRMIYRWW
jgi:hypothetical protein